MPTGLWASLADLVLPTACAGCGAERVSLRLGACTRCVAELSSLRPFAASPDPVPAGFPACLALGVYQGVLRESLLQYKERGRHGLAVPLGALLAEVVVAAASRPGQARPGGGHHGVLLIPIPSTARAVRERHGDHLRRIARETARRLRVAGWPAVVAQPLRALPRPDSVKLGSAGRQAAAREAFRARPAALSVVRRAASERTVILLDDIVTTGATLSAATGRLAAAGVPVHAAAVLAATPRRRVTTLSWTFSPDRA